MTIRKSGNSHNNGGKHNHNNQHYDGHNFQFCEPIQIALCICVYRCPWSIANCNRFREKIKSKLTHDSQGHSPWRSGKKQV